MPIGDQQKTQQRARRTSPLSEAVNARDAEIIQMVQRAIENSNVLLAFQPVMSAQRPERPAFYEGLIRVLDSTGRVIPAKYFIGSIETTQIGREIDRLSLKMGMETLAKVPGLRLSVNMSARSIRNPRWMDELYYGLAQSPTIGERLILEITESSAMDMPEVTLDFMDELQTQGITFALDDFGAGYTSFRYLRDFYFDMIKIDGSFIRGIHNDPDNQALTKALISLAQHFEMFTVAEYVESAADAEYLMEAGIDGLQGYFFGAPTSNPSWVTASQGKRAG
jgi:EAL domain-containing protein (putative c-di-GMP-specific phosphodiesterase class I)